MITKPEDAIPSRVYLEEPSGGHGGSRKMDIQTRMFTASECAEIAKAYLDDYLAERSAMWGSKKEHKKANSKVLAWRAKFKEWETTK